MRIADGQAYDFAHFVGSDPEGGDTVHSGNVFKRIAGVLGLAGKSADGSGVAGATVELIRSGKVLAKATTDADGFYAIGYKHKGKAATFTVRFRGEATLTQNVTLKANGWGRGQLRPLHRRRELGVRQQYQEVALHSVLDPSRRANHRGPRECGASSFPDGSLRRAPCRGARLTSESAEPRAVAPEERCQRRRSGTLRS